nr:hypothetical protein [Tanacetum cinerariifolium]GEX39248.1 hypothetical protein [Tanacetum cinerariifolium]
MSTQQDIYDVGFENYPPKLNKDNYVLWFSRLLRYEKSKPNGKLIYNSIINGLYVKRMIHELGNLVTCLANDERFCYWGSGKKAKLFNEWERFISPDEESIESYYHCFSKLMNDFKRNKYFPEKIASNIKFLNNLQPEWKRHITIARQTKDLHEVDYIQVYDFLKMNQEKNGHIVVPRIANLNANQNRNGNVVATRAEGNGNRNNGNQVRCYNCKGMGHLARNCIVRPRRRDGTYLQTQLMIAQKKEARMQL